MNPKVLFCWEIGEHSGHVSPYLGLLEGLQDAGWEVALALKNTSVLDAEARSRFPIVFQAPVCLNEFTGIAPVPASFTELCLGFGYAHVDTLAGLVRGWRALFATWRPDLVISNFAPVSLLAARIDGIARLRLGTGFENSPPGFPLPLLAAWSPRIEERLERAESLALKTAGAVLRELGRAPASSLSEIVAEVPTMLATIPELDRFANRGPEGVTYLGALPHSGRSGTVPEGTADVFAYLRSDFPSGKAAIDALAKSEFSAWAYVPDVSEAESAAMSHRHLVVSRHPYDLGATLSRVRFVVGYAGHGTVLAALLAGRPMVLLPSNGEQAENAKRVAGLGLGVSVAPNAKPGQVRAAIERCANDGTLQENSRRMAEKFKEWNPARALPRALEVCAQVVADRSGLRVVGRSP